MVYQQRKVKKFGNNLKISKLFHVQAHLCTYVFSQTGTISILETSNENFANFSIRIFEAIHNESSKQFDIGVASILFKNVNHFSFLIAPATGTSGTDVLTVEGDIEVM